MPPKRARESAAAPPTKAALAAAQAKAAAAVSAQAAAEKTAAAATAAASAASSALSSDLSCCVCADIFEVPCALPRCGHVLCRACIAQASEEAQFKSVCPLCRTALFSGSMSALLRQAGKSAPAAVRDWPELRMLRGACALARGAAAESSSLASARLLRLLGAGSPRRTSALLEKRALMLISRIKRGVADDVDACDSSCRSLLWWAAGPSGSRALVDALLAKGARADIESTGDDDEEYRSPLRNWLGAWTFADTPAAEDIATTKALVKQRLKYAAALDDVRAGFELAETPALKLVLVDMLPAIIAAPMRMSRGDPGLAAVGIAYLERLIGEKLDDDEFDVAAADDDDDDDSE